MKGECSIAADRRGWQCRETATGDNNRGRVGSWGRKAILCREVAVMIGLTSWLKNIYRYWRRGRRRPAARVLRKMKAKKEKGKAELLREIIFFYQFGGQGLTYPV